MAIYSSSVALEGNRIEGNLGNDADSYQFGGGYGGGVYLRGNEAVTLSNNRVRFNVASTSGVCSGGGIASYGGGTGESRLVMLDNVIEGNLGSVMGGGVGGGAYLSGRDLFGSPISKTNFHMTLQGNRILSNTSALSDNFNLGGGIIIVSSQATMLGDIFQNNHAHGSVGIGGGLIIYESDAWLTNTVFLANQASSSGAGLMVESGANVQVRHATFSQHDSASSIFIVRITSGSSPEPPSSVSMTNVIIAGSPIGVEVRNENTLVMDHVLWSVNSFTISSTIPAPPITITNEINGYPGFAADGYHLAGSPFSDAIGQGTWAGVAHDIDGEPRRSPPDIGSDEYWEVAPTPRSYLPLIFK